MRIGWLWAVISAGLFAMGCGGESRAVDGGADSDSDVDSDSDSDSDSDTETGGTDTDTGTDTGTGTDTDTSCSGAEVDCNGVCVDVTTDPGNCGSCGNACGAGAACNAGVCNCGGEDCRPGEVCDAGACRCAPGTLDCVALCANVADDEANCGACGNECPVGGICEAGRCVCPAGEINCGDACVDTTSDPANCGACGEFCAGACISGACDCGVLEECELAAWRGGGSVCTDTDFDAENCGDCNIVCLADQYCAAGACACRPGWIDCPAGGWLDCTNADTNPRACGACGVSCGDEVCVDGACAADCPAEDERCELGWAPDYCADLDNDVENCGACANPCQVDDLCVEGECTDYHPAFGCDACPCDTCAEGTSCCTFPGTEADPFAVCVEADVCPS